MSARRTALPAGILTAVCLFGLDADLGAQSRVVVVPSVSLGFVYDDNLFYEATGELEAIWRLSSGLTVERESQRTMLFADLSADVERFREHPALSTPLARQSASLRVRSQAAPRVVIGFEGAFDSTRAPTELNLTTGLLTGRRRAYRLSGGPSVTMDATPRTKVTVDYDLAGEIIPDGALLISGGPGEVLEASSPASRLWTHAAGARVTHGVTPRNALRLDYVGRWFVLEDAGTLPVPSATAPAPESPDVAPPPGTILTHTAFVGWTFRVNPAVNLDVAAGPRFRQGTAGVDGVEAEALLSRQRVTHDVFLSYVRAVTTAVGLRSLIEIDRALLRGVYRPPFGVNTEGEVGFYRSTIDEQSVRVFRLSGGVAVPLRGPVAIGFSYAVDFQQGRFGLDPALRPVAAITPGIEPAALVDPDAPMRRGVAMVRLIIAPRIRRAPEDPPPGATPVRTPPVKRSDR